MLEAPRRAPRLAGAHPRWRSTLASTFHGFRVHRAPVFLFVFCTCLDQAGAGFGMGLARGFLPAGLQSLNLLNLSRLERCVQGLDLGLARGFSLSSDQAWNPCPDQAGAIEASNFLQPLSLQGPGWERPPGRPPKIPGGGLFEGSGSERRL